MKLLDIALEDSKKLEKDKASLLREQERLGYVLPDSLGETPAFTFAWYTTAVATARNKEEVEEHARACMLIDAGRPRTLLEISCNNDGSVSSIEFREVRAGFADSADEERIGKRADSIRRSRVKYATMVKGPVGRNDPCPCGSGLKHKKCCLGA